MLVNPFIYSIHDIYSIMYTADPWYTWYIHKNQNRINYCCVSVCLCVCVSVCLYSVCLCVCVSVYQDMSTQRSKCLTARHRTNYCVVGHTCLPVSIACKQTNNEVATKWAIRSSNERADFEKLVDLVEREFFLISREVVWVEVVGELHKHAPVPSFSFRGHSCAVTQLYSGHSGRVANAQLHRVGQLHPRAPFPFPWFSWTRPPL